LRPIQMIIPLAAGSAGDAALRVVTAKMAIDLRKQIVIENVPGAAGMIGATRAARATPDGYTIVGISDSVLTSVPLLNKNAKFDPLKDFDPVSQIVTNEWVLVANPSFPAKSVQDLVALAKSEPGTIDFSSGGNGSPQHIAMEMLMARTGTKLIHVPYRGATSALTDVVAGTVPLMFTAIAVAQPFLNCCRRWGCWLCVVYLDVDYGPGRHTGAHRRQTAYCRGCGAERHRRSQQTSGAGRRPERKYT